MENRNYLESNPNLVIFDSDGNVSGRSDSIEGLVRLEGEGAEKRVSRYDSKEGFHKITNPGWIIFDLGQEEEISYIRFLLWDNCGAGKKQPSRRKYLYRLLIAGEISAEESGGRALKWEAVYDTLYNGSNGWQEFFFESAPKRIRYIKLHLIYNTRNEYTHLVNIQAYPYPTRQLYNYSKGIVDEPPRKRRWRLWGKKEGERVEMAFPIHGLINNRIILGYQGEDLECGISLSIYERVSQMLGQLTDSTPELSHIKTEIDERLKELYSIDKELQCFQHSIYYPVARDMKRQRIRLRTIAVFSSMALALSIFQCIFDLNTLFTAPAVQRWWLGIIQFFEELFAGNV